MSQGNATPQPDQAAILRAITILAEPGQVVELRALEVTMGRRWPHTQAGYFSDCDALAKAAAEISRSALGVYITLNPVNPALLARAANTLKVAGRGAGTSDADVVRRRWLPIDIDPIRPAGISATEEERDAALGIACTIEESLAQEGWPEPVFAGSGNGYHLLYKVALPNDHDSTLLLKEVLAALATRFDGAAAKVDHSVFNAARIWKLYGTWAKKGDNTVDRPHRRANILRVPEQIGVVSRDLLAGLAANYRGKEVSCQSRLTRTALGGSEPITPGQRHKMLVSLAGTMLKRGMGEVEIAAALVAVNAERCEPPLDEDRVRHLVTDVVGRYGRGDSPATEDDSLPTPAPEPQAPPVVETEVERFPLEVLPGPARRLVEAGAKSLGCPPDLIAVPVLAALGTAIGTARRIELKPGWSEGAAIYAAVVARPGGAKSPAQVLALAPLHAAQEQFHEEYIAVCRGQKDSKQAREKAAPQGTAVKSPQVAGGKKAQKERALKEAGGGARVLPPERQVVSTDSTTEALALLLRQNTHGILYEQDELTALTGGFDRYRRGVGADRQFFQSAWSGQEIVINRVKQVKGARRLDTIRVAHPFLSVIGGVQPDMLGELSDERGREDGFIHRFAFSFPQAISSRYCADGVDEDVRRDYQDLIDGLLSRLPVPFLPEAASVSFTPEGDELWRDFMEAHTAELNDPNFPDHLRGPWRKLSSYCARLALILQLARYVCGEADAEQVDDISVDNAALLVRYFKSHAQRTYQHLRNEPANERVTALLEWITQHGGSASLREVLTAKVAQCKNAGDVLALFERLTRAGVGQIISTANRNGGRPTIRFCIEGKDDR